MKNKKVLFVLALIFAFTALSAEAQPALSLDFPTITPLMNSKADIQSMPQLTETAEQPAGAEQSNEETVIVETRSGDQVTLEEKPLSEALADDTAPAAPAERQTEVSEVQSAAEAAEQKQPETKTVSAEKKDASAARPEKKAVYTPFTVHFGADTSSEDVTRFVKKARNAGVDNARVVTKRVKGAKWWYAQADASSAKEAVKIAGKLRALGMDTFITTPLEISDEAKPQDAKQPEAAAKTKPAAQQPAAAAQKPAGSQPPYTVHFGADKSSEDVARFVDKARKNGIEGASVVTKEIKGVKWWYAQAPASSLAEAQKLASKLNSLGMKTFITTIYVKD